MKSGEAVGPVRILPRFLALAAFLPLSLGIVSFFSFGCGSSSDSAQPGPDATSTEDLSSEMALSDRIFGRVPQNPEPEISDPRQLAELRERGEYLVNGPGACGQCHAAGKDQPLSGGKQLQDRFGQVFAANITPDKETGIGNWELKDVVRAIRASLGLDNRTLSLDLHATYRWMSDADAKAVAAYLLALPPVRSEVERRELGTFERKSWGLFSRYRNTEGFVPAPPKSKSTAYGRYLSYHVAGCYGCHTPEGGVIEDAIPFSGIKPEDRGLISSFKALFTLLIPESEETKKQQVESTMHGLLSAEGQKEYLGESGAEQPTESVATESVPRPEGYDSKFDQVIADGVFPIAGPDIRGNSEDGLARWKREDIVQYLSSGTALDGKIRDPRVCPWNYFQRMAASDKEAIASFLKQQ